MTLRSQRIVYDDFCLLVDPLVKGTTFSSNDKDVFYSYIANGVVEIVSGCGKYEGNTYVEGDTFPAGEIANLGPRTFAIHEDGTFNCFFHRLNRKVNIKVDVVVVDGSVNIEPNIKVLVLKGKFNVDNNFAMQYDLIASRPNTITIEGKGTVAKLTILGEANETTD
jgi:hypothetical protein